MQGSALSPILGNVYLHYVLDDWLETEVRPRLRGRMRLIRYADDFVIGFQLEDDARRVMAVLGKRMERFGLNMQSRKDPTVSICSPEQVAAKRQGTDKPSISWASPCIGGAVRRVFWRPGFVTRKARQRRAVMSIERLVSAPPTSAGEGATCRAQAEAERSSQLLQRQPATGSACERCSTMSEDPGTSGCDGAVQRTRMTWARFNALLKVFRSPSPTVRVQLWV